MKKIKTLLPKSDVAGLVVAGEITVPVTHFALKIDGTSTMILDGKPYCRYDIKIFKRKHGKIVNRLSDEELSNKIPIGAIACQEPDELSGHWPHWVPVLEGDANQKYILEGFNNLQEKQDGTYECIGPKIGSNPHGIEVYKWIRHQSKELIYEVSPTWKDDPYNYFRTLFEKDFHWEGLVAYNDKETVAKIRRSDFGFEEIKYNKI